MKVEKNEDENFQLFIRNSCSLQNLITKNSILFDHDFVGNKAKKANLKTDVSRKQSTPKFPKNKHFLPPEERIVCFSEILA